MPQRLRLGRALILFAGVIGGLVAMPALASANHHIMMVREVFPGASNTSFVELQMYAAGQGVVEAHDITLYGPTGMLTHAFNFPGNVANDTVGQESILVGDTAAAGSPDFTDSALELPPAGGGACFISNDFGPLDCVSWGNFTGTLPDASGAPVSPAGVTAGKSLERTIARGCDLKLDAPDDTDDSAADFSEQTPSPRNNSVTPTETDCPVPPNTTLSAIGRPSNPTTATSATFNFTATGNSTGFECTLETDPGFTACASPKEYAAGTFPEGTHTFQVRAVGPGGPDTSPASYTWRVDLTAPDTSIAGGQPTNPTASPSANMSFTSTEAMSTFRCKLSRPTDPNPSFGTCPAGGYTGLTSGEHTFTVEATDQAGNPDPSPASYTWTVDRTPPDTSITAMPPNPSNSAAADFDFSSTEPNSTFRCRLDSAAEFTACPAGGAYTGLIDGSHTFRVRAVDALGNEDASEATYTWTVDATSDPPPQTTITKAPKRKGSDRTPTIKFAAEPVAGSTFQCRVDDKPFVPCTSPHTTKRLKFGKHSFEVAAIGPGGIDLTPAEASFKVVR